MKQKKPRTFAQQEAIQVGRTLAPYILVLCLIVWILVKR